MTDKWEELVRKERQLTYQLEDAERNRFRAEQTLEMVEDYDSRDRAISENNTWEAAYGSRYAYQLEENRELLHRTKNHLFDTMIDCIDKLKLDERQMEEDLEEISFAKRKEYWNDMD